MLSSKTCNRSIIEMYQGKTYIETKITLFTEINDELKEKFYNRIDLIEGVLAAMNNNIEDMVMDSFEENTDIAEIISSVNGKLI